MIFKKKKYRIADMVLLMYKVTPFYCSLVILDTLVQSMFPVINIFVTAKFIDTAKSVLAGALDSSAIFMPISALVLVSLWQVVEGYLMGFVNTRIEIVARTKIRAEMFDRRAALDYKYMENQEKLDLINRVCGNLDDGIKNQFHRILGLATLIAQVASVMAVLVAQVVWSAVILIALSVPLFILAGKAGKKQYDANKEVTKIDRKAGYLSGMLQSRDSIEERYIFGYTDKINEDYIREYEKSRLFRKKVDKKNFINMKGGSVLFALITMIIAGVLLPPTIAGTMSIGIFISLLQALSGLVQQMSWSLAWYAREIVFYIQYLKDLGDFLSLDNADESTLGMPSYPPVEFSSLEFRNVSFKYPGTENYVLRDMSFKIESGKHYSIVGVNGAGKTTVAKLITGLYRDFEGEIELNGKNINDYRQADLKSLCSAVFQDFAKYYISIGENIALGNINNANNKAEVERAANLLHLDGAVTKLPKGFDTPLGKIKEDGVDISGGEWQRVALARAVMSPAPLRILDEPTAALDPLSESGVYKQFEEISGGGEGKNKHATIFISHRLGSTKLADIILVIGDGRVLEEGSHNELMEMNGIYAEMYATQADWYKSETGAELEAAV